MAAIDNLTVAITAMTVAVDAAIAKFTGGGTTATDAQIQAAADAVTAQTAKLVALVTPVTATPTLDPIANLALPVNSPAQVVQLTGIQTKNPAQSLAVTANSDNAAVAPDPVVTYTSPQTTGSLSITPVAGAVGVATITVIVDDTAGNPKVNTFTVTVA